MSSKLRSRRLLAGFLVLLGAVLMFLAPEMWIGVVLLVLGVAIELAGIALEHKS